MVGLCGARERSVVDVVTAVASGVTLLGGS